MAKNVALSKDAYTKLERLKMPRESFSDVVLRLTGEEKTDWRKSIGALKGDKDADRIFNEILESRHKKTARSPRFKW
ncbi:MAG: antitoxin VapB family protein [Candidatus Aenigmarchaeota archaeon]|nr:antitoxin VapB family protein [Candidatus Aenigmarchaeota archaeon]MDI6722085.1 antitoxin VapB family protein [Candidatus Aenigmarchaeota archaeon]